MTIFMSPFFLSVTGFLSGITAAMGLGGGFVLLIVFSVWGQFSQLENQLINLIFFLPIAVLSVILHLKSGLIEKKVLPRAILTGVAGVIIGVLMSQLVSGEMLKKLFGALIIVVGVRELLKKANTSK